MKDSNELFENRVPIEISNILDCENCIEDLKAVIFDLDDTLYSEKEYVRSGFKKIAELFPWVDNVENKLWNIFLENRTAIDEFLKQEFLFNDENKRKCLEVYRYQKPDIKLYPGVRNMLINMRKEYRLGIITDGRPEGQRSKIEALDLGDLFDHIIITDELGGINYRKPNDIAFQLMSDKLRVDFNKMCYIGDNVKKDFVAPQKLGMRCIWVRNLNGLYVSEFA